MSSSRPDSGASPPQHGANYRLGEPNREGDDTPVPAATLIPDPRLTVVSEDRFGDADGFVGGTAFDGRCDHDLDAAADVLGRDYLGPEPDLRSHGDRGGEPDLVQAVVHRQGGALNFENLREHDAEQ
jgi:hypothetical protein